MKSSRLVLVVLILLSLLSFGCTRYTTVGSYSFPQQIDLTNLTYIYINGTNSYANFIQFNTTYTDPPAEGKLRWSADDGTLEVGMPGGDVNLQIGEENLIRVKADETISNGQLVYVNGADGANPTVKLAQANNETISHRTLAMATENIANNQKGYITTFGLVRGLNTNSYPAGTQLYLSTTTPGAFTNVPGSDPNYQISIGYVIRQSATEGVIFVSIHDDIWKTEIDQQYLRNSGDNATGNYNFINNVNVGNITYTDVYYDDEKASFDSSTKPGTNGIVLKTWKGNIQSWAFEEKAVNSEEAAIVDLQYSHRRKTNSSLECHFHFNVPTASTANITMYLEYNCAGVNQNYSTTNYNVTKSFQLNGNAYSAQLLNFGTIDSACNDGLSMIQKNYLRRLSSNPSDTYTGDVFADYFDCHFQIDSPGSREEYIK